MKKILVVLFALLLMIPVVSLNAKEKAKVKVYIFEAGGCPYCEAEVEYLQKLDSYNKKFTIERRELYVDHVNWAPGRDYELGKAVAEKFQNDGFEDASYQGTPFVVISDLYAAATYSTSLESYINDAYKKGDKDVVNQIAKKLKVENVNRKDIGAGKSTDPTEAGEVTIGTSYASNEKAPNVWVVIGGVVVLVIAMVFVIKKGGNGTEEVERVEKEETAPTKVVKKAPAKKTTTTKKTVKKTNKK